MIWFLVILTTASIALLLCLGLLKTASRVSRHDEETELYFMQTKQTQEKTNA